MLFSVARREDLSHSGEVGTCGSEVSAIQQTPRNGRTAQGENGGADAGEGTGRA